MSKCQDCRMDMGHNDDCPQVASDTIESLRAQLTEAGDLLLERGRQAEELLTERDGALALAAEMRGVLELYIRHEGPGTRLTCSQLVEIAQKRMALTPAAALELQRARRAVVEAAKLSRAAERSLAREQDDTGNAALEEILEQEFEGSIDALKAAVDALEKLEARGS